MKSWRPTPVPRRPFPSERARLPWIARLALLVLVAVFVEVWESTWVSQAALETDRVEKQLAQLEARRDYLDAQIAAAQSRPALASAAKRFAMQPADPSQIVVVPADYLASSDPAPGSDTSLAALGWRALEALVPQARARSR